MGHAMQFFPSLNSTKFSLYSIRIDFLLSRNLSLWYYQRVISPTPLSLFLSFSVQRSEHYRYLHSTWCTIVCIINSKHICIFRAAYIHGKTIINIARLIRFSS